MQMTVLRTSQCKQQGIFFTGDWPKDGLMHVYMKQAKIWCYNSYPRHTQAICTYTVPVAGQDSTNT